MVTQMCRLSVLSCLVFLFYFYSFSPVVAFIHTRQCWAREEREKESKYVYMYVYTYIFCSDGGSSRLHRMCEEERPWEIRQTHLYSFWRYRTSYNDNILPFISFVSYLYILWTFRWSWIVICSYLSYCLELFIVKSHLNHYARTMSKLLECHPLMAMMNLKSICTKDDFYRMIRFYVRIFFCRRNKLNALLSFQWQ